MLLCAHEDYDFEMKYYNADGNTSSMCGNGGRCIAAFAKQLGIIKTETNFLAVDGAHYAKISDNGWVSLEMQVFSEIETHALGKYVHTGSPHLIIFAEGVKNKDVYTEGHAIRYNDIYKAEGVNINFVEELSPNALYVRTYERGVEAETYSCGTGVTAAALAYKNGELGTHEVAIETLGGKLNIRFINTANGAKDIFLEGPAERVYEGVVKNI